MPKPVGQLVFDTDWKVVEANASARTLLRSGLSHSRQGRSIPAPQVLAQEVAGPQRLPCSRYRVWQLANGRSRGFLLHYSGEGTRYVLHFEPAEWSLGFVDQLQAAVAAVDEQGRVVYINRAASRLLGLAPDAVLGQAAMDLAKSIALSPADAEALQRLAQTPGPAADAVEVHLPERGHTRLHYRLSPWHYRGCRCGTVISLFDDPEPEEARRQAALALAYRLGAMYQHELRNPLQTILAAVDVLRAHPDPNPPRVLRMIEDQVRLMSDYLADQLQPPQPTKLVWGRLSDVVEAEIDRSRLRLPTRLLTLRNERLPDEPPMRLHPASLGRAFANLFRNSAQARRDACITVRYAVEPDRLVCSVSDDGPGFPASMLNDGWLAAGRDATRHLGLFVVASTVEAHGGAVWWGNSLGAGACVRISLPLAVRGAQAEVAVGAD